MINSDQFSIFSVKYPSKEEGYIAPGMSVELKVRFHP